MSSHTSTGPVRPVTTHTLFSYKKKGRRIAAVTAYDYTMARLVDQAGIDVILVGDSLGNVIQGLSTTLPVTLDDIIYHSRAVRRGVQRAHIVGDLPFMTYQVSPQEAVRNAGRLMKEGAVQSVKLEGGRHVVKAVSLMVSAGIPVMGHLGLTPQSVHQLGGYKVQGRDDSGAARILEDAIQLQEAGVYALVLECVPDRLAQRITAGLDIPTIGIGAGAHCDGQILVMHDVLGLNEEFRPRFVRQFANLGEQARAALTAYAEEVRQGTFPAAEETFDPQPALAVVSSGGS